MATRKQITDLRLLVNDPPGFVTITEVADATSLPGTPTQDTCYYQVDKTKYVATVEETGATSADYTLQRIRVSDVQIGDLIDSLGADEARCRVLRLITPKLGADMQLASTSMGGDTAGYTSLQQMYRYYVGLVEDCEKQIASDADNSTGREGRMESPEIAGGLT